jgi:hypothetical protein
MCVITNFKNLDGPQQDLDVGEMQTCTDLFKHSNNVIYTKIDFISLYLFYMLESLNNDKFIQT